VRQPSSRKPLWFVRKGRLLASQAVPRLLPAGTQAGVSMLAGSSPASGVWHGWNEVVRWIVITACTMWGAAARGRCPDGHRSDTRADAADGCVVVASGLVARDDGPGGTSPEEHARRILSERFANGDIDSEEFMQRRVCSTGHPG